MHIRRKILAAAASVTLLGGITALTAGTAHAAPAPLPAYPNTITLNLGSPNCVTDDVIMNDPLDSTSPITDTASQPPGAGADGVVSRDTPPLKYYLWYLNSSNAWQFLPPPGMQINQVSGVISAYNGDTTIGSPGGAIAGDIPGAAPVPSDTGTYTVRDHGKDSYGVGAVGTEQFQITLTVVAPVSPAIYPVVTIKYAGNTFNNAGGELTIQLNSAGNALTLAAVANSLLIPGSTPVTFTLVGGSYPAWKLNSGTTGTVLTGNSTSDPNIEAVTADHDVVFFALSGISTDSGGVFYVNSDANPCVNTQPVVTPTPTPTTTTPPPVSNYGDEVNPFGNGFDVYRQHASVNTPVIVWPATQLDPATHFLFESEGGPDFRIEYAPNGVGTGLCISNPFPSGQSGLLSLRGCNTGPWQEFYKSGGLVISAVNGGVVNPDGRGSQWSTGASAVSWGGANLAFTPFASLPA